MDIMKLKDPNLIFALRTYSHCTHGMNRNQCTKQHKIISNRVYLIIESPDFFLFIYCYLDVGAFHST